VELEFSRIVVQLRELGVELVHQFFDKQEHVLVWTLQSVWCVRYGDCVRARQSKHLLTR
jgi:hypothetical protein